MHTHAYPRIEATAQQHRHLLAFTAQQRIDAGIEA